MKNQIIFPITVLFGGYLPTMFLKTFRFDNTRCFFFYRKTEVICTNERWSLVRKFDASNWYNVTPITLKLSLRGNY